MGIETLVTIAASLVAADFGLALQRPSMHDRLSGAYMALIAYPMFMGAGALGATWIIEAMASPAIPQIKSITDTVEAKTILLTGGLIGLLILHACARLVAGVSAEDQIKNKKR